MRVIVHAPKKAADYYGFACEFGNRTPTIGFRPVGWEIPHNTLWDSIAPLWFLTAFRGPFFKRWPALSNKAPQHPEAHVVELAFPVHEAVAKFFERRAEAYGYKMTVEAVSSWSGTVQQPPTGCALALGGGKDSRCLLGMLRELGKDPAVFVDLQGLTRPHGLKSVMGHRGLWDSQVSRLLPALMHNPSELFIGCGSGEAEYMSPWQWCYEYSAWQPLAEFSDLLAECGMQTRLKAPLAATPYHLNQKILVQDYPDLYAFQDTAPDMSRTAKSMHVAICEIMHGGDPRVRCPKPLFKTLAKTWVNQQIGRFAPPSAWQGFARELRALMYEVQSWPWMDCVRADIPASWEGDWIHYVHDYMDPDMDPEMLAIFHRHLPSISEAPEGTFRFPQPD
jgi:hypothetical protein